MLKIEALDRSAAQAFATLEAAEQRQKHAQKSGDSAGETAAREDVKTARAGVVLTDTDKEQLAKTIETVDGAVANVPDEGLSPRARRAIAASLCVAALVVIIVGVIVAVDEYKSTTVTADDVANSVRAVRAPRKRPAVRSTTPRTRTHAN